MEAKAGFFATHFYDAKHFLMMSIAFVCEAKRVEKVVDLTFHSNICEPAVENMRM